MSICFFINKSLFVKEKLNSCNGILCSLLCQYLGVQLLNSNNFLKFILLKLKLLLCMRKKESPRRNKTKISRIQS